MINMTNIRADVWKLIDSDPSIKLDLERKLINVRALARYCRGRGINSTDDAVISAIRRYPMQNDAKKLNMALEVAGKSTISTRSHIANIALKKGTEVKEMLPKLFPCVDYERSETLHISQGEESVRVMVDEKNLSDTLALIPKKLILNVRSGLAVINLHLHPEAVKTPGIAFVVTGELFRNNINMYEIMSCVPELLIFVEEKDILKAYQILFELCHKK